MTFEELKVTKVIRWVISGFKLKTQNETFKKSKVAILSYDQNVTSWFMKLFTNGQAEEDKEHVSLYLYLESAKSKDFLAKWSFILQNENGLEVTQGFCECNGQEYCNIEGYGYQRLISHQELSENVKDCRRVTIICQLSIYGSKHKKYVKSSLKTVPSIHQDFKKMFEDEILCDLDIKTNDGVTLRAHKNILAARSPVFLKMLTTDMKESKTNSVEIEDFESKTIRELLRFIYCEEVEDFEKNARNLIYAAEKYEITKLKDKSVEEIASKVINQNVIEALIIADEISGTEKLIKACAPIISICLPEVLKDPKWEELSKVMVKKLMAEIWNISNTCEV